eukprot:Gb_20624 [translate_table: standard]
MQHVSSPSLPTNIVFKAPIEIRSNVQESVHDVNDRSFTEDIVTNVLNDVDLADIVDGDDYRSIISSYQDNLKILMEHPPTDISTARSVKQVLDRLVQECNTQELVDYNFPLHPGAHDQSLKRKKSFLSPKGKSKSKGTKSTIKKGTEIIPNTSAIAEDSGGDHTKYKCNS